MFVQLFKLEMQRKDVIQVNKIHVLIGGKVYMSNIRCCKFCNIEIFLCPSPCEEMDYCDKQERENMECEVEC